MNLFDKLVDTALAHQPDLALLRPVVEKELLHHDILRILSQHDLLKDLTFIGGTCLRACYGGVRLSEDLDFTGGHTFSKTQLENLGRIMTEKIYEKYQLPVVVSPPQKDNSNVDTWKITITTKPQQKHLPAQRIHLDICRVPSYEPQPMLLINPYGVDMGTQGLIIKAQSLEEIFADKLLAFALRPNSIKYRDLWDMLWLHQRAIEPRFSLIPKKLNDRQITPQTFLTQFNERRNLLQSQPTLSQAFQQEMQRFLPKNQQLNGEKAQQLWAFIDYLLADAAKKMRANTA